MACRASSCCALTAENGELIFLCYVFGAMTWYRSSIKTAASGPDSPTERQNLHKPNFNKTLQAIIVKPTEKTLQGGTSQSPRAPLLPGGQGDTDPGTTRAKAPQGPERPSSWRALQESPRCPAGHGPGNAAPSRERPGRGSRRGGRGGAAGAGRATGGLRAGSTAPRIT